MMFYYLILFLWNKLLNQAEDSNFVFVVGRISMSYTLSQIDLFLVVKILFVSHLINVSHKGLHTIAQS